MAIDHVSQLSTQIDVISWLTFGQWDVNNTVGWDAWGFSKESLCLFLLLSVWNMDQKAGALAATLGPWVNFEGRHHIYAKDAYTERACIPSTYGAPTPALGSWPLNFFHERKIAGGRGWGGTKSRGARFHKEGNVQNLPLYHEKFDSWNKSFLISKLLQNHRNQSIVMI